MRAMQRGGEDSAYNAASVGSAWAWGRSTKAMPDSQETPGSVAVSEAGIAGGDGGVAAACGDLTASEVVGAGVASSPPADAAMPEAGGDGSGTPRYGVATPEHVGDAGASTPLAGAAVSEAGGDAGSPPPVEMYHMTEQELEADTLELGGPADDLAMPLVGAAVPASVDDPPSAAWAVDEADRSRSPRRRSTLLGRKTYATFQKLHGASGAWRKGRAKCPFPRWA